MTLFRSTRTFITASLLGLLLLGTTIYANQQRPKQNAEAVVTSQLVLQIVERYHIAQQKIDDKISSQLLKNYIEDLDPQKLYFYKSDIDALSQYDKKLDDLVRKGDLQFAFSTFDSYLQRLDDRMATVHKLIDTDFDFTKDEEISIDPDLKPWSVTRKEADERWRKRIKYNILSLIVDDVKIEEARERLHKRYRGISRIYHQMSREEQMEMFLTAMTLCLDPHSTYMSPRTLEDFNINMRLSLEGIGASLRSEDGFTIVQKVIKGGAASKDGRLQAGDKIVGVGQAEGKIVDIVEMKLNDVVRLIRGKKGTIVRLQVKTAKAGELIVYQMIRQKVELTSSAVSGEIIETKDRIGRTFKVGVVHVPSFYRDFSGAQAGVKDFRSSSADVDKVLKDFRAKGVDSVIVDLRSNGGGALSEAIEMSGLFIDRGAVVQIKQQNGRVKALPDTVAGVSWDGPLVVVCNRLSASASEIFAGAIKDYGRGVIVGDKTTHGKGTVQNVMPVSKQAFLMRPKDYGALKLTIQQFYRVNGDSTQHRGVRSDIILPSKIDHMELGESFLDNALPFNHIPEATFTPTHSVSSKQVALLKTNSATRVAADPKFQKLSKEIDDFVDYQKKKTFPLNETKFRKLMELAKSKSQKEKEKKEKEEEAPAAEKEIFPDTFYNNELLNIAGDLAESAKNAKTAQATNVAQ